MARPEKVQAVQEIQDRLNESQAVLLTEYRGLTVTEMAELRRELRRVEADYKVFKNTLARIAVKDVGYEDLIGMLEGPTAIAFVKGDAVEAAKALDDAARRFPVLVVKGGLLRGRVIGADQARELARLQPREVQLATIAMMMNSPLQQTVNVFAALLRDLGSMLAQVVAKKESGELASPGESPQAAEPPEADRPASSVAVEAETTDPSTPDVDQPEGGEGEQQGQPTPATDTPEGRPTDEGAAGAKAVSQKAVSDGPGASEETLENPQVGPAPQQDPDARPVEEAGESPSEKEK